LSIHHLSVGSTVSTPQQQRRNWGTSNALRVRTKANNAPILGPPTNVSAFFLTKFRNPSGALLDARLMGLLGHPALPGWRLILADEGLFLTIFGGPFVHCS
jgi:hypothetical protein